MIRRAFTMRLKPDSSAEYKYHHDNIWPELLAEIERCGIASITTFQRGLDLFVVSDIRDEAAWDRLWSSEIHKRWGEVMEPLVHLRDDGIVDAVEWVEIFHVATPRRRAIRATAWAHAGAAGDEFASPSPAYPDDDYVLGEASDEDLAEDMQIGHSAAGVLNDPLAALIAESAATAPLPAPSEPAEPSPPASAEPAPPRNAQRRAARKKSARKPPPKKAHRNSAKPRTMRAAKKAKKKRAARKPAPKKPAKAKAKVARPVKKKGRGRKRK